MSKVGTYNPDSLSGSFVKRNRFYLEDGSNVYRILPPFGSLAESSQIAKYWEVYTVLDSKGWKRRFSSLLKTKGRGKERVVIQNCPMTDKVEALRNVCTALAASKGENDPIVIEMKETLKGLMLDRGYYVNALSTDGKIGALKIPISAWQDLKTVLDELRKDQVDPINVGPNNGLFFDFKRVKSPDTGKVEYKVEVAKVTRKENGRLVADYMMAPIDDNVLRRMETEAFDLATLFKVPTLEEAAALATLDPKTADRVFARPELVEKPKAAGGINLDAGDDGAEEETEDVLPQVLTNGNAAVAAATVTSNVSVAQAVKMSEKEQALLQQFLNSRS